MGNAVVKQVLIELTRGGCRVETLLYDPPAVMFRSPNGARCALTTDQGEFRLTQSIDDPTDEQVIQFPTLREALRAAIAA
jgi:hypothetical protein